MISQADFRRGSFWAAAIAAVACILLLPAVASAANGSIGGTVTEAAAGHAPIEEVEVCAEGVGATVDFNCVETDAAGTYLIPGLTPGEYVVEFWARPLGYLTQYYNGKAKRADADEVTVVSATTTPGIDAELVTGATIEGAVADAVSKAGLGGVEVCAWLEEGPEEFEFGGCTETASNGDYSIGALADGDYIVEFWSFADPDYVFEYYDDSLFWEGATRVTLAAGGTETGIDSELSKGGKIAGTVTNAANNLPLEGIEVCAREGAAPHRYLRCGWTTTAGQYTIRGLPTGSYKVEFSAQFEGEPDDGFPTQYYSGKATLAEATLVGVTAPATVFGINAKLGTPPSLPVVVTPGGTSSTGTAPGATTTGPTPGGATKPGPKRCKKGLKRKRVKGKTRCVKVVKHHRR